MEKCLGRIKKATFGFGGYDDAMIGLSLSFGGESWGVNDFNGTWATRTEFAKWSIEDQRSHFADAVILLRDTLREAKRAHVAELAGVPVEVTFDGGRLKSWRVLSEVL